MARLSLLDAADQDRVRQSYDVAMHAMGKIDATQ
jgi:hypothetical protein